MGLEDILVAANFIWPDRPFLFALLLLATTLRSVSPPPILAAMLAAYFKEGEEKKGGRRTQESLSPLCLELQGKAGLRPPSAVQVLPTLTGSSVTRGTRDGNGLVAQVGEGRLPDG